MCFLFLVSPFSLSFWLELALLSSWRGQVAPPPPCFHFDLDRLILISFPLFLHFFTLPIFCGSRVHFGRVVLSFDLRLVWRRRPLFLANKQPSNFLNNDPPRSSTCFLNLAVCKITQPWPENTTSPQLPLPPNENARLFGFCAHMARRLWEYGLTFFFIGAVWNSATENPGAATHHGSQERHRWLSCGPCSGG